MASANDLVKQVQKFTLDNSPLLLTAVGAAGVITTAVLSAKGGIKAAKIMEDERYNRSIRRTGQEDSHFEFTIKEVAGLTWKCYLPAVGSVVLTCGAIVGANQIGTRRAAAVATALSISDKAFSEYKEKVVKHIGEKGEQKVTDELAQDRVTRDASGAEVIIMSGDEQMFYDTYSARFFKGNMESVKSAENRLNHQIINQNYASLSDFYDFVGLPHTAISDDVGWNVDKLLEIEYSATMTPDGRTAMSLTYRVEPIRDYFRLH